MHACMHTCKYAYTHTCIHACMHECTCILANMWTRIHAYLTRYATFHQSTATSHAKRVRLYVCMYVCGGEHVHGAQKKWAAGSGKRWLGRKTRRQDFCRRLMEKILHHQMHLKSRPSCSPFNIGVKKRAQNKEVEWLKSCTGAKGFRTQHWKGGAGVQVIVYCQICPRRCRISSINSIISKTSYIGLGFRVLYTMPWLKDLPWQINKPRLLIWNRKRWRRSICHPAKATSGHERNCLKF